MSTCFVVLNRLRFLAETKLCRGFQITVLDAVIRFELVYGLELTQIPKDMLQEVNVCQLKGLRQILK